MASEPATHRVRCILVATDFSPTATVAFDWAVEFGRTRGAGVVLVHAIEAVGMSSLPMELQEAVSRSLNVLVRAAERQGVEAKGVWRSGKAWDVIRDVQRERGCDLIVVGARGHTGYAPTLLGSRADRIVRTAGVPVVTVHHRDKEPALHTVLVATDFSEEAALATSSAVRILAGSPPPRRLVLLHITQSLIPYEYFRAGGIGPLPPVADTPNTEALLAAAAAPLASEDLEVTTVSRSGYPAAMIEDEARSIGADMIALGTQGRSGLRRLLLGSIAERVLHHAPCPVLTVRRPDAGQAVTLAEEQVTV